MRPVALELIAVRSNDKATRTIASREGDGLEAFFESVRTYVFSGNFFRGALITLALTILSQTIGIILGLVVALTRSSRWQVIRAVAGLYVWFLRGTPVLLQLIFVYAALPQFGVRFSAFQSAVVALSLNEGA